MKQWYVIQVYAGHEEMVRSELLKRIQDEGLEDKFGQVLVPAAKMKQFFGAEDAMQDQQLFPGYVLVEMEATPEAIRLVSTTPRVLKFLGGKSPVPLSQDEINRVLAQMRGEVPVQLQTHAFEVGSEVEITGGPFAGFVGVVDEVDESNEKLRVMVSIFGRMTPVELSFDQAKA